MGHALGGLLLVGCFVAANACSSSSSATYCSGSEGPVTASEAEQLKDAEMCPPAGYSNGACVEGGGSRIQGAPAPAWTCVVQDGEGGSGSGK